jgi:hypothetical protein
MVVNASGPSRAITSVQPAAGPAEPPRVSPPEAAACDCSHPCDVGCFHGLLFHQIGQHGGRFSHALQTALRPGAGCHRLSRARSLRRTEAAEGLAARGPIDWDSNGASAMEVSVDERRPPAFTHEHVCARLAFRPCAKHRSHAMVSAVCVTPARDAIQRTWIGTATSSNACPWVAASVTTTRWPSVVAARGAPKTSIVAGEMTTGALRGTPLAPND